MNELVVLGSGGWIPTERRETCCYAVRRDSDLLVLDAGTGVRRLLERPDLLEGVTAVHIVLTHFHLDHVVGLGYLPALTSPGSVTIWAPGERLYGVPPLRTLERLLGEPFFPAGLHSIASDVVDLEGPVDLGRFRLDVRSQSRHSEPTLAIRVDDVVTYCTDTAFDEGNIPFARNSRLLLHEAWHATAGTSDEIHSAAGEAARIAEAAGVEVLVLVHLNPLLDSDSSLLEAAGNEFGRSEVGTDLVSFDLS